MKTDNGVTQPSLNTDIAHRPALRFDEPAEKPRSGLVQDKSHYRSDSDSGSGELNHEQQNSESLSFDPESLSNQAGWNQSPGRRRGRLPKTAGGKRVRFQVRLEPLWADRLAQVARRNGVSDAKAIAAFVEMGLQTDLERQHASLLKPLIEQTVHQAISAELKSIRSVQVRTLFEVARIWQVVGDLLNLSLGMNEEAYEQTIKDATNAARQQFYIRSPKVRRLVDELEKALIDASQDELEQQKEDSKE